MSDSNTVYVLTRNTPLFIRELKRIMPTTEFKDAASDSNFKKAEVMIVDVDLFIPHIYSLPNLKWAQGIWAGLELLLPHITKPLPFIFTRFASDRFGQTMAEYIITNITIFERNLHQVHANWQENVWSNEGKIYYYRTVSDLSIGIMGLGNIGGWVARCLSMLGAKIYGYGRSPSLNRQLDFIAPDSYYTKSDINTFLSKCDYIINTLPSTPETEGLLNGEVLKSCADRKPIFINVGRGTIIGENDLIRALENDWLSHAILDVFEIEPLPKESPLWNMKKIWITPHVAAVSQAAHLSEHFKHNWNLYKNNKKLVGIYSYKAGY